MGYVTGERVREDTSGDGIAESGANRVTEGAERVSDRPIASTIRQSSVGNADSPSQVQTGDDCRPFVLHCTLNEHLRRVRE